MVLRVQEKSHCFWRGGRHEPICLQARHRKPLKLRRSATIQGKNSQSGTLQTECRVWFLRGLTKMLRIDYLNAKTHNIVCLFFLFKKILPEVLSYQIYFLPACLPTRQSLSLFLFPPSSLFLFFFLNSNYTNVILFDIISQLLVLCFYFSILHFIFLFMFWLDHSYLPIFSFTFPSHCSAC